MSKPTKKVSQDRQTRRAPAGQITKQEKRSRAFVAITRYKRQAYLALKTARQARFM